MPSETPEPTQEQRERARSFLSSDAGYYVGHYPNSRRAADELAATLAAEAAPLREEIERLTKLQEATALERERTGAELAIAQDAAEAKIERLTKEKYGFWGLLCDTTEALGMLMPEKTPYLPGWAKKYREETEAKVLSLEAEIDEERQHANEWLAQLHDAKRDALAAASRAREEQGALRAALEGLRYPFDPMEPDAPPRFCGHAAEPCDRCAAARRALAPPAAESQENQQQLTGKGSNGRAD